jgi:hypothetical protein
MVPSWKWMKISKGLYTVRILQKRFNYDILISLDDWWVPCMNYQIAYMVNTLCRLPINEIYLAI